MIWQSRVYQKFVLGCCVLFALGASGLSQSTSSTVLGDVLDPTGAVIPAADITITNQETGITRATTTDRNGRYVYPEIAPGAYRIDVHKEGFEATRISGIEVPATASVRRNVTLRLGSASDKVEVEASAPVITTDSASLGTTVEEQQINRLPVNGRTVDQFIQYVAGNVGSGAGQPRIGGAIRDGGAFFSVDGVPYQDVALGRGAADAQGLGQFPSLASIQELKVVSNVPNAEYEGSVAIVLVTKGGTNQFHGSAFEFNRNREFAASPFFSAPSARKPTFNRNEFGVDLGGPIVANRTFFHFSYEGLRQRTASNTALNLPTAAMNGGNFAGLGTIIDPLSNAPFPGSVIPSDRIDARADQLRSFLPLPNAAGSGPAGTGINYYGVTPTRSDEDRYTLRFDHQLSPRHQITASADYANNSPVVAGYGTPPNFGNLADTGRVTKDATLGATSTLTPGTLNEFRYSYFMNREIYEGQNLSYDPTKLFPGLLTPLSVGGLPTVTITGYQGLSDYGGALGLAPQITNQFSDNVTRIQGAHQIKGGILFAMIRQSRPANVDPPALGEFDFNGRYTGNAYADFLLGDAVSTARAQQADVSLLHYWRIAGFLQDEWKVNRRLTATVGLRYEYQSAPLERDGRMSNFDPVSGTFVVRTVNGRYPSTAVPRVLQAFPIGKSEDLSWGRNLMIADPNGYGPRVGLAWRPWGDRTVIRAGYGIFQALVYHGYGLFGTFFANPPFQLTESFEALAGNTPSLTLANPFPGTGSIPANPRLLAVQHQLRLPYAQAWNFTVERELAANLGLRVSYVGNKGTAIDRSTTNWNLPRSQTPGTIQSNRPYQPWGDINALVFDGSSITHQLQVEVTQRTRAGLTLQSNFTWNKSLDNVPASGITQNPYDTAADRGNADGIRDRVWHTSLLYDLPFGPGKRFLTQNRPLGHLVGGWSTGLFLVVASGPPLSVTFSPTAAGWYATRADVVSGVDTHPDHKSENQWFNPAAFTIPQPFTFGNSGRNILFGPGMSDLDFNITKQVQMTERVRMEIRADAFNLPNSVSLGNPNSNISVPSTVGRIRSSTVSARVIQFGLKVSF